MIKAHLARLRLTAATVDPTTLPTHLSPGEILTRSSDEDLKSHEMRDFANAVARDRTHLSKFQSDPRFAALLNGLAALIGGQKQSAGASARPGKAPTTDSELKRVDAVLRDTPHNVPALRKKAALLTKQQKYRASAEVCRELVRLSADDPAKSAADYHRLAVSQIRAGDLTAACVSLNQSLCRQPDATVAAELGRLQKLLRKRRMAEYENQEIGQRAFEEGRRWQAEQRFADALACFRTAIRRWPREPSFFVSRAVVFSDINEINLAIRDCEAALELDPKSTDAMKRKAVCYFRQGDFQWAIRTYERILEIEPNDQDAAEGVRAIDAEIQRRRAPPEGTVGYPPHDGPEQAPQDPNVAAT
jgi:tetratricopeptide (TPR) repeat protein